jgi:DNA-binding response OmpR family regulator
LETFDGCRCGVLDETVGGRSAFEWLLLFRATAQGRDTPVLVLVDRERPESQVNDTILAAYLAGFDMCLTKPFDLDEFQNFAKRLRNE